MDERIDDATSKEMLDCIFDRHSIREVLSKWTFSRDGMDWIALGDCFHVGASIHISWYSGPFEGFIEASRAMGPTKHINGDSIQSIQPKRAVSDCNATILARAKCFSAELDLTCHLRFLDWFERRQGRWGIVKRQAIYEKDRLNLVKPSILGRCLLRWMPLKRYPDACRHLCFAMETRGYRISSDIVTASSDEEKALYDASSQWLAE